MIKESKLRFARKYTAIRFVCGLYKPGNYRCIAPFGDISVDNIKWLQHIGILDSNVQRGVVDRLTTTGKPVKGRYIVDIHNTYSTESLLPEERLFRQEYTDARQKLNGRFGYVSSEDVLSFMRTKRLVQKLPYPTMKNRRDFISQYETENGVFLESDVEFAWGEIMKSLDKNFE